ncbi:phage protein [Burkholderia cenocepacia]|jgi:hypothetical protein|uniref:Hypothetical phage protein n=2 Tax=Burkholderia cenocepacia TaxID=95486 RepID=B4EB65_BURCJ|nr:hypothetical protein [Burkholderia cenocepacia]KIS49204.1 hypothetical protein NP88_6972 [Burkholderia cepacia]EPZ85849.1 hypothetical protein BURCENK562V_C5928 [Burkholderia cenocepacia K56-2Valvano]KKI79823.1 hypothetical protein WQ49_35175 [Burkholderia cenocepacia]KKI81653.1 hypothetical protein WQ49_14515 [Burkholderia cenocepacia]ONR55487.1 hypothetical protein A8E17_23935 [Burkholderia cenocepacia]
MSVEQYLRKASLVIGGDDGNGLDFSDMRFTFEIRRGDAETPNSARINVYNLSKNTANRVGDEFSRVVVSAGYEGGCGLLFDGSLIQARQGRESPTDTVLRLTCADGDRAYNFAYVNTTLAAGATHADVIEAALTAMQPKGVTRGYMPDLPGNPYPRGRVLFGMARDVMRCTARDLDMDWSIQDGKLTMIPKTSFIPGEIHVVTAETGMIGMPTQMKNYIVVKMLLNPRIRIGSVIQLKNASVQQYEFGLGIKDQPQNRFDALHNKLNNPTGEYGFYRVMIAEHRGDTRGNDWYTEATCIAVDASAQVDLLGKGTRDAIAPAPPKIDPNNPFPRPGPVNPYG